MGEFKAIGFVLATTDVPVSICPSCGQKLEQVTSFEGKEPKPGDVSICIKCRNIMVFDEEMKLRPPNLKELEEILDYFARGWRP